MWLHVPKQFMGSASARESEASTSASALPSESDIELPLMLNNALTVRPPSWRGWQTRPWIRLLWPTISQVLTANRGAERFRSSLPDCPANPTQLPGASEDTQTLEHSVKTSPARCPTHSELSESVCPPWCFSKTSQAGFDFLDLSEKSWQDWATGLRQDFSRRRSRVRHTAGKGSSFMRNEYPTPAAQTYGKNQGGGAGAGTGPERPSLETWAAKWPTPTGGQGGNASRSGKRKDELLLAGLARTLARSLSRGQGWRNGLGSCQET